MDRIDLKTRTGLNLFRFYRFLQTRMHELNYLFWECTLRCNLRCIHCGSDCRKDSSTTDMPVDDFLKVLDEISREYNPHKVMIAVTGGEPLVRSDLETCGRQFMKRGFPWGMVTNGMLLDSKRLSALKESGLRSITVSLDGLEVSHNWMRGSNNSFSKALSAISLCGQSKDLVFDVVTCVNRRNIAELSQLKEALIRLQAKKWRLFTVFPRGRATGVSDLALPAGDFTRLLDFINECRKENVIQASYGCEGFLGSYEGKVRDGFFFCRAGISVASILADGNISACPSMRGDFIQGSIYKDSFIECWHKKYENMRNRSWAKSGKCASCNVFKWCNGNGLHLREGSEKNLMKCHYESINEAEKSIAH